MDSLPEGELAVPHHGRTSIEQPALLLGHVEDFESTKSMKYLVSEKSTAKDEHDERTVLNARAMARLARLENPSWWQSLIK